jgi:glucans biosynthesis protein
MREGTLRHERARTGRLAAVLVLLGTLVAAGPAASATPFTFENVVERARRLAAEPYVDPKGQVPNWLLKLTYDEWRSIRFRADQALWRGETPFQVQFFHPGLFYDRAVKMNTVDAKGAKPLEFSPNQFDYGPNDFASRVPQKLGYAGFRVHYPIKTREYWDEVIVFLGASYFRAVGKDQVFGLSARAIAVDTAESHGEEFPFFREFWLVRPARNAREMSVYALLDSPSLVGAYRFVVAPGEATVVKVDSLLFMRTEVRKVGIAPLTSMFFHGENTPARSVEDFRPEVHDSDGVLMNLSSGEWLWRPMDNPHALHVSSLQADGLAGFGLLQRDRDFDHYQDLETRADLRPSVWIEPHGEWKDGRVEVVEIPTENDTNDNAVAYWVPKRQPKPGEPGSFSYVMRWYGEDHTRPPGARVLATRRDRGTVKNAHRFVIDFVGKKLNAIPADRVLRGVVSVAGGAEVAELVEQHVVKNEVTGGWRLTFQVVPKGRGPVELRAFLDQGGETLSETWSYALLP